MFILSLDLLLQCNTPSIRNILQEAIKGSKHCLININLPDLTLHYTSTLGYPKNSPEPVYAQRSATHSELNFRGFHDETNGEMMKQH